MKRHMQVKHSPILDQEHINQDIAGVRGHTPFAQPEILNVKYEVNDHELLEDSIEV